MSFMIRQNSNLWKGSHKIFFPLSSIHLTKHLLPILLCYTLPASSALLLILLVFSMVVLERHKKRAEQVPVQWCRYQKLQCSGEGIRNCSVTLFLLSLWRSKAFLSLECPFSLSRSKVISFSLRLFLFLQVLFKALPCHHIHSSLPIKSMLLFTSCCAVLCIFMLFDKFTSTYSTVDDAGCILYVIQTTTYLILFYCMWYNWYAFFFILLYSIVQVHEHLYVILHYAIFCLFFVSHP